ncbi:MAG: hypothetical protein ABIH25_00270 [Candidatus Woesearchaeota archaeon]
MGKRTTEFVLGLLGGIFGFGTAFFGFFFSLIATEIGGSIPWIFAGSIVAIVGSVFVKSKAKIGGIIMLLGGITILISSGLFGILPFVLLFIAGLMGLIKKDGKRK